LPIRRLICENEEGESKRKKERERKGERERGGGGRRTSGRVYNETGDRARRGSVVRPAV